MPGVHKRLSASAAEIYIPCPGAIFLLDTVKGEGEEDSEYSREGSAAHELGEKCLIEGADCWEFVGQRSHEYPDLEYSSDMADAVQIYVDYCRGLEEKYSECRWYTEVSVDDPNIHPDYGGTVDRLGVSDTMVHVIDYKHGIGVVKNPFENPQIMYYAYGVLHDAPRIEEVHLTIVQPRAHHDDGPIRTWITTRDEIVMWAELTLLPAMDRAGTPEYTLGEHCQFCKRKLACPNMKGAFKDMTELNNPVALPGKELSEYLEKISPVKKLIKELESVAYSRLAKKEKVPGFKLVMGKINRIWKVGAEKTLKNKFGKKAFTEPSLKSPAQMEKVPGGQSYVDRLAYKPEGKPTVAPASDHRPEYLPPEGKEIFSGYENKIDKD